MNELRLHPLTCPQCGAPGAVREGTRITGCERCGATLCLSHVASPKYEAETNLDAAQAQTAARVWLRGRDQKSLVRRPELVLVPFHEIAGRRIGVFERKVPERHRVHRTVYSAEAGGADVESKWVYTQKQDTKVMVSDVQHMEVAARTRWNLRAFDARDARQRAALRSFDLVEAQRRATVYSEERSAADLTAQRFADHGAAEVVAASRRTIFFPFWSVPVQMRGGEYEIVVDGIAGNIVAWRVPSPYPARALAWVAPSVLGAFAIGHALRGILFGSALVDPAIVLLVGVAVGGFGLARAGRPDWSLTVWPEPDSAPEAAHAS